jgi:hypothetical protein
MRVARRCLATSRESISVVQHLTRPHPVSGQRVISCDTDPLQGDVAHFGEFAQGTNRIEERDV